VGRRGIGCHSFMQKRGMGAIVGGMAFEKSQNGTRSQRDFASGLSFKKQEAMTVPGLERFCEEDVETNEKEKRLEEEQPCCF